MSQVNLKVQVHCLKPSWVNFEKNRYRLYVNEYMLTERSWIWDVKTFIDENIWVELQSDIEHKITLVPLLDPTTSFAQFVLKNLRINGNLYPVETEEQLELSFRI
jgi:hypothetical protein